MSHTATLAAFAAIDSLRGTLQVARALAQGGRAIELDGLEAQAARLCIAIGLLPPETARPLRPALLGLVRDVDGLRAALPCPSEPPDPPLAA